MEGMIQELFSYECGLHKDSRGFLCFFEQWPIHSFHLGSMQPGAVRGNHTHVADEIICILGAAGNCRVELNDESSGRRLELTVEDDPALYRVKAGIRHTLTNTGEQTFYLVSFLA